MRVKRLACVFFALVSMVMSFVASAAPAVDLSSNALMDDTSVASPKAEETEWYYRIYNGHLQKRLWSLTRGIWLTEWEDC